MLELYILYFPDMGKYFYYFIDFGSLETNCLTVNYLKNIQI